MDAKTIDGWQARQLEWRKRMFPGQPSPVEGGLGVAEELGELAHAELKLFQTARYGREPRYEGVDFDALARDACADAVIYGLSLCNCLGIDMSHAVERARGWVRKEDILSSSKSAALRAMAEASVHAGLLAVLVTYDEPVIPSILRRVGAVVAWLEVYAGYKGFDLTTTVEETLTEVCKRVRS